MADTASRLSRRAQIEGFQSPVATSAFGDLVAAAKMFNATGSEDVGMSILSPPALPSSPLPDCRSPLNAGSTYVAPASPLKGGSAFPFPWETNAGDLTGVPPMSTMLPMQNPGVPPMTTILPAQTSVGPMSGGAMFASDLNAPPVSNTYSQVGNYAMSTGLANFQDESLASMITSPGPVTKGAPIVLNAPAPQAREEFILQPRMNTVRRSPSPIPSPARPNQVNQVVTERIFHERSAGLTLVEVQGMLKVHHTQMMAELQAKLQQERSCLLPEVNTMLQKQYICIKKDVETKIQQERAKVIELRSNLLNEALGQTHAQLQQNRMEVLQEAQTLVEQVTSQAFVLQQVRAPILGEVQSMMQMERAQVFQNMQELMQQQLTTLSDSTATELGRMVTMVNAVQAACDEQVKRLDANSSTLLSNMEDLKQDVAQNVLVDRLTRIEGELCASTSLHQESERNHQDMRENLSGVESRILSLTVAHEDHLGQFQDHLGNFLEFSSDDTHLTAMDGHAMKLNEVIASLESDRQSLTARHSQLKEETRAETLKAGLEVQSQVNQSVGQVSQTLEAFIAKLEDARASDFQELTQLVKLEGQARSDMKQGLDVQNGETSKLKDRLAALEKFSEEFSGEVQDWMISIKKGTKKSGAEPQSLDRYREILSLRGEFRN